MYTDQALAFTIVVSVSSILVIVGAALMGAYKFLKNVGFFRGHYYY